MPLEEIKEEMSNTQFNKKVVKPAITSIYDKAIDLSLEEDYLNMSGDKYVPWDDDNDKMPWNLSTFIS